VSPVDVESGTWKNDGNGYSKPYAGAVPNTDLLEKQLRICGGNALPEIELSEGARPTALHRTVETPSGHTLKSFSGRGFAVLD